MSIPTAPEYPQYPPIQYPSQPPAPKSKFNWVLALAFLGTALLGGVIGSAYSPTSTPAAQEVTPEACLDALDLNEQAIGYLSESMGHILDGNYTAANRTTEKAKVLIPEVNAAKAECRSK